MNRVAGGNFGHPFSIQRIIMDRKISKNSSHGRITNRDLQTILKEELQKREKQKFLNEGIDDLLAEGFMDKVKNFFKGIFGQSSKTITTSIQRTTTAIDKGQLKAVEEVASIFSKLESPEQAMAIGQAMTQMEERAKEAFKKITKESISSIANEGMENNDATAVVGMLMQIAYPTVDPDNGFKLQGWQNIKKALEIAATGKKKEAKADDSDGDGKEQLQTTDADES